MGTAFARAAAGFLRDAAARELHAPCGHPRNPVTYGARAPVRCSLSSPARAVADRERLPRRRNGSPTIVFHPFALSGEQDDKTFELWHVASFLGTRREAPCKRPPGPALLRAFPGRTAFFGGISRNFARSGSALDAPARGSNAGPQPAAEAIERPSALSRVRNTHVYGGKGDRRQARRFPPRC